MNTNCIFCKIVAGDAPAHIIWEDEKHVAFLSIFPNTKGFTVVCTRAHHDSYVVGLDEGVYTELMLASREVALLLDKALDGVARTGTITEGFGVDHAHVKLFPMHNTASEKEWQQHSSSTNKFFDEYEGYISSHDSDRADDEELEKLAKQIRDANNSTVD